MQILSNGLGYGTILIALLTGSPAGFGRDRGEPRTQLSKTFDVKVSSANQRNQRSSFSDPDVTAVQDELEPLLLHLMDPDMAPTAIQERLAECFPGAVSLQSMAQYYVWVWCHVEMRWERVCCLLSTFNVALTTTVRVDVEVVTKPGG